MRIRLVWLVVAVVFMLVIPTPARADGHRAGLFGGYSAAEGSVLNGVNISFDHTFDVSNKGDWRKYLAVMADFSSHETGRKVFSAGVSASGRFDRVVVAAHGLVGRVWGDGSADVAGTLGGDIEFVAVSRTLSSKAVVEIAPLARADYIVRRGTAPSFWRVSTGLVVRWSK